MLFVSDGPVPHRLDRSRRATTSQRVISTVVTSALAFRQVIFLAFDLRLVTGSSPVSHVSRSTRVTLVLLRKGFWMVCHSICSSEIACSCSS